MTNFREQQVGEHQPGENGLRAANRRRAPKFGTWIPRSILYVQRFWSVAVKCLHDGGEQSTAGDADFTQRTSKINPRRTMRTTFFSRECPLPSQSAVDATSLSSCCVERIHLVKEQEVPVGIAVVAYPRRVENSLKLYPFLGHLTSGSRTWPSSTR